MGIKTIKGRDFQAYMRVMPHAEYPSGSGCACTGLEDVLNGIIGHHLGAEAVDTFKVSRHFDVGSSSVDEGVPAEAFTLSYTGMEAMRKACGQSRINGGIHFLASVPAAEELCKGVGTKSFEYIKDMIDGENCGCLAAG